MIADPLTKTMLSERLVNTKMTGKLDMTPTPESLMIEEKAVQLRDHVRLLTVYDQ